MHDDDLLRYSRHILLNEIGFEGQQRIGQARVLIIGAGGLGAPVGLYLSSAGVGHITVVDDDAVDLTNLQRQIAHTEARVGWPKVDSLKKAMGEINHLVQVRTIQARADADLLDELVAGADVVLDCCDNYATRHAINAACVAHQTPLVSGAAIRFDGQVCVYDQRDADSPCYACVFPPDEALEETRCATLGVFAPLVGIIGTLQAGETLKLICGIGQALTGRLLMLDGRSMSFSEMRIQRNPACPVCGASTSA